MEWDKTLKQLDHTTTPLLFARHWGTKEDTLQLVSDGINVVYRFEAPSGEYYLRITHEAIRGEKELAAAIDYQRHLYENNAPICRPVLSENGRYIESIQQGAHLFFAHVCGAVPGEVMHFNHRDLRVYEKWGRALAELHRAAKTYRPAASYQFRSWSDLHEGLIEYLSEEDAVVKREFQAVSNWLDTLNKDDDSFGLTHSDHREGNVLYDGKQIHIIDFDEPVYHWFAADVARPFLNPTIEGTKNIQDKLKAYLAGYRSIAPFSKEQASNLPWFIRMKVLDMYLWTRNNWVNATAPGGGQTRNWLKLMRQAINEPCM